MQRIQSLLKSQFLAFILAMLLIPVLLVISQRLTNGLVESNKWVEHSYSVLNHIEHLHNDVELIETARRGYAITRQEQYLRPYYKGRLEVNQELEALKGLTADNPRQQSRLMAITPLVESLVRVATEEIESDTVDNNKSAASMVQAKLDIDRYRLLIDEMRNEENKLLAPRAAETGSKLNNVRLLMLLMLAVFIVLLLFSFISMYRENRRREKVEDELKKSQVHNELTVTNLSLMAAMTSLLQSCTYTEESLEVIAQFASKLLDADAGELYLFRESRNQVEASSAWGLPCKSEPIFQPDDCWALRRGESHVFDHKRQTLACKHLLNAKQVTSLCIPIVAQGNVLGILHLENQLGKDINELDYSLATNLASQIALALASIKLRDTLRNLSVRDPLTGLFNRRYMEESLQREIATARRKKRSLGVVIFDLDHFKIFNDTFGHEAGDVLLREVGSLMTKNSRSGDIACRFGGEEFVMIYPEAETEIVINLSNRLREEIYAMQLQHFGRSLGQISASFGISFFPEHGDNSEDLLRLADQALYLAKANGRNRLEIAVVASAPSLVSSS